MKSSKTRLVLSLIAMFLLGAVSGIGISFFGRPFMVPHPRPEEMQKHFVDFLTRRLDLTPDQQEKIKPIAANFAQEAESLHQQSMTQFRQLSDDTDAKISDILNPTQKTELDKLRQQREEEFKKHGGPPGP